MTKEPLLLVGAIHQTTKIIFKTINAVKSPDGKFVMKKGSETNSRTVNIPNTVQYLSQSIETSNSSRATDFIELNVG